MMTIHNSLKCTAFFFLILVHGSFSPATAARLSGLVRDTMLIPVQNVDVSLFDDKGNPIGIPPTITDATGAYEITGLPKTRYQVGFEAPDSTLLAPVLFDRVDIQGPTTLDVTLQPGFVLSGVVTNEEDLPVLDIDLNVETLQGVRLLTPGDNTNLQGFYDIILPAGTFSVTWRPVGAVAPYIPETKIVTISDNKEIDITMKLGVFITGTVRNLSGNPIQNINLDFIDADTGVKLVTPGDNTDLFGFYNVQLPKGDYIIRAKPQPSTLLQPFESTEVHFEQNQSFDITMQPGLSLSGTVTQLSGLPVSGVDIDIEDAATGKSVLLVFDHTDSLGHYQVIVAPGTYDIAYQPIGSTTLAPLLIPAVNVISSTVQNAVLPQGVLISGSVTQIDGQPIIEVDIDVKDTVGLDVPIINDFTDAFGNYSFLIAPGTYTIEYEPAKTTSIAAVRLETLWLPIALSIPIVLRQGFHITGTVTDVVGSLLREVSVEAKLNPFGISLFTPGNQTDIDGNYDIVIPPGFCGFVYSADSLVINSPPITLPASQITADLDLNIVFPALVTTDTDDEPGVPGNPSVRLEPNFPNPFNPSTTIPFALDRASSVELAIYNLRGQQVRLLEQGLFPAGTFFPVWNGLDNQGKSAPSGVYIYRLRAGIQSKARKMLLLK